MPIATPIRLIKAAFCLLAVWPVTAQGQVAPRGDYHEHLFSPATAAQVTGQPQSPGISAAQLVALLDSAGIKRALVLSTAYTRSKSIARLVRLIVASGCPRSWFSRGISW